MPPENLEHATCGAAPEVAAKPAKKLYPAPDIEEMRAQIRRLGVHDPDRLLSHLQWGGDLEFTNNS